MAKQTRQTSPPSLPSLPLRFSLALTTDILDNFRRVHELLQLRPFSRNEAENIHQREEHRSYAVEIVDALLLNNPQIHKHLSLPKPQLIMDSANFENGKNIPKVFAANKEMFDKWCIGWDPPWYIDEIRTVLRCESFEGQTPLSESEPEYWEVWESFLRDALLIDSAGVHFHLEQDQQDNLWAVPTIREEPLI